MIYNAVLNKEIKLQRGRPILAIKERTWTLADGMAVLNNCWSPWLPNLLLHLGTPTGTRLLIPTATRLLIPTGPPFLQTLRTPNMDGPIITL